MKRSGRKKRTGMIYEYIKKTVCRYTPLGFYLKKNYYTRIYHYVSGIIFNFLFKHIMIILTIVKIAFVPITCVIYSYLILVHFILSLSCYIKILFKLLKSGVPTPVIASHPLTAGKPLGHPCLLLPVTTS